MSYTNKEHDALVSCKDKADFEATKAGFMLERKIEIAVAMKAQHMLYNDINFDDSFDKLTLLYRGLSSTIDNKLRSYGHFPDNDAMTHQLSGYDSEVDHYDIDRNLERVFGDDVMTDSESGMFVVMVKNDRVDEVKAYLKGHFHTLTFDVRDNRDDAIFTPTIKELSNWPKADEFVKEYGLIGKVNRFLDKLNS